MYLSKICIKNFRAFDYIELEFNSGVNIIIGENNSGKSAIIDALRICLVSYFIFSCIIWQEFSNSEQVLIPFL